MLQDPNSGVFNFFPNIQDIPSLDDFDFATLTPFVASSSHLVSYIVA